MKDELGIQWTTTEIVIMLLIAGAAGMLAGSSLRRTEERAEAIRAGVARYEVSPTTGQTTFRYINPNQPNQ